MDPTEAMPVIPTSFPPGTSAWAVALIATAMAVIFFTHTFGDTIKSWMANIIRKKDEQRADRDLVRDRERDHTARYGDDDRMATLVSDKLLEKVRKEYGDEWDTLTRHSDSLYKQMVGTGLLGRDGLIALLLEHTAASSAMQVQVNAMWKDWYRHKPRSDSDLAGEVRKADAIRRPRSGNGDDNDSR